jgi:hypothetical protein
MVRLLALLASGVARVAWEGETRWTAAQLLRASEEGGGEERTVLEEARSWLRTAIANGPAWRKRSSKRQKSMVSALLPSCVPRKPKGSSPGRWAMAGSGGCRRQVIPIKVSKSRKGRKVSNPPGMHILKS